MSISPLSATSNVRDPSSALGAHAACYGDEFVTHVENLNFHQFDYKPMKYIPIIFEHNEYIELCGKSKYLTNKSCQKNKSKQW